MSRTSSSLVSCTLLRICKTAFASSLAASSVSRYITISLLIVPGGYLLSPPKLPADAPVLYIFQPIFISGQKFIAGMYFDFAISTPLLNARSGHLLHLYKPLRRYFWFYNRIGSLAITKPGRYSSSFTKILFLCNCCNDFFLALQNDPCPQTSVRLRLVCHRHSMYQSLQMVFNANVIIVDIVCRSNFQCTGTKFVNIVIKNHGNGSVNKRNNYLLSFKG